MTRTAIFDLDGTLVDSDLALRAPFVALGVDPAAIPLGLPLGEACDLAGISVEAYLAEYDDAAVMAFPGVGEMLARLDRWSVCSNKTRSSGSSELHRLGWSPELALFSEDFDGQPKRLAPVLEAMELTPGQVVFFGDTDHDRHAAAEAGVQFVLAGWNGRASTQPGDVVLRHPNEVLDLLAEG